MGEIRQPTREARDRLDRELAGFGEREAQNAQFFAFYGRHAPLLARHYTSWQKDEEGHKIPTKDGGFVPSKGTRTIPLRTREWIERFVRIRDKRGGIVPLIPNFTQRNFHAAVLRQRRAGLPVRQIVLKARKQGISTWSEALAFEASVRDKHSKSLVVAHDDDTSSEVLKMVALMRDNTPKASGGKWEFGLKHQATYHIAWLGPMYGELKIASASKNDPGRGFTPNFCHLSEMAFYPDAERTMKSILNSVPKLKTTTIIIESTAFGDVGEFRNRFWAAWDERGIALHDRNQSWNANFYPWFWDDDCRWTRTVGEGRALPVDMQFEIRSTLNDHERWLLTQKFFRRWRESDTWEEVTDGGRRRWRRKEAGWRTVDIDQLAWRRFALRDEFNANPHKPETWGPFQEEFPATPEEAFRATGELIFDVDRVHKHLSLARDPVWMGDLVDMKEDDADTTLETIKTRLLMPPRE